MLPGEIQVQCEAANNPSSVEEKPGQQQGSAEEMWLFSFWSNIKTTINMYVYKLIQNKLMN